MTVLGVDTATNRGSVALARAGELLAAASLQERGAHARDLLVAIDGLLDRAALRPPDLGGIAVTLGPGSFTGVRIGLATAKGLAYALDIGLAGLSTLDAVARAAAGAATPAPWLCAALEAGRGEVYAALFEMVAGEPARRTEDRSYRPADLAARLPPGTRVVGDGAATVERAVREIGGGVDVLEGPLPLAGPLALWGCATLIPGGHYMPGTARPNYVRPSGADTPRR